MTDNICDNESSHPALLKQQALRHNTTTAPCSAQATSSALSQQQITAPCPAQATGSAPLQTNGTLFCPDNRLCAIIRRHHPALLKVQEPSRSRRNVACGRCPPSSNLATSSSTTGPLAVAASPSGDLMDLSSPNTDNPTNEVGCPNTTLCK
uniref:Uncharacterized protein n=1 Tax=Glossina pallidipes TaxID=7398 RepID=A0A1A9ZBA3_GLOPL